MSPLLLARGIFRLLPPAIMPGPDMSPAPVA